MSTGERYRKQVLQELHASRRQKKEVLRDLKEVFDSAAEHGETEEQVVTRLGEPKAFAASVEESSGCGRNRYGRKRIAGICLFAVSAACFLLLFLTSNVWMRPRDIIGQADATTWIIVKNSSSVDVFALLLGVGCAAFAAAVLLIVLARKRKKR